MNCKKCGAPLNENAKFCGKCGTVCGEPSEVKTETKTNAGISLSTVTSAVLKYRNVIVTAVEVIALLYCIYVGASGGSYHMTSVQINFVKALIFIGIIPLVLSLYNLFANRGKSEYKCPKCNEITKHNQYHVCEKCFLDVGASAVLKLLCFIGALFCSGIVNEVFMRGHSDGQAFIVTCIAFMIVALITPIYMYPAKMARKTGHSAATAIFWLNIFLGVTLIMWIVLLIWASSGNGNTKQVVVQNAAAQASQSPAKSVQDSFNEIKALHDMGAISDEEFEEKRKELLARI